VLQELLVHHIGTHVPLHRGIRAVDELVSQTGPDVIAHTGKIMFRTKKALFLELVVAAFDRMTDRRAGSAVVTRRADAYPRGAV
jgi:hypothetical protein